jgi:hypothetical protein
MMAAFGGLGLRASSLPALCSALQQAVQHAQRGAGCVVLDPLAGVDPGNVHAFFAPKAKVVKGQQGRSL